MAHSVPETPGLEARPELAAALVFLDGTRTPGWTVRDLGCWFDREVVPLGVMARPLMANEPVAGTVALYPGAERSQTGASILPKVLLAARIRVLGPLRGLLESPADDRFLASTIFSGRVRRQRVDGNAQWAAHPEPTAPLSAIVLSLLAVDILSHRELYDRELCVCDVCGRVSFDPKAADRKTCGEHSPSSSGFVWKAVR
ncbi:MAG: hypothetical protein U0359_06755 [Byssovorax sp.]